MTEKLVKTDLTTKDLTTIFGVSNMTLHNWQNGLTSKPALPSTMKNGRRIFKPTQVKSWATKNGVALLADPLAYVDAAPTAKPGPRNVAKPDKAKPRAKPTKH
jgi:hypothetical protein